MRVRFPPPALVQNERLTPQENHRRVKLGGALVERVLLSARSVVDAVALLVDDPRGHAQPPRMKPSDITLVAHLAGTDSRSGSSLAAGGANARQQHSDSEA
ncbi:MAG: hypothetical protein H0T71_03350 [Acidobacteria bacterium]|nr:hypothetical protein [Acidobacteriota bacterium]